jgi:hypothetical protein
MNDTAAVRDALPNRIAPMAAQSPGFLTGYWTMKDDAGLAILIFPSKLPQALRWNGSGFAARDCRKW